MGLKYFEKANKKYDNKFIYSVTSYTGYHKPLIVMCPVHGFLDVTADNHFKYGCIKCNREQEIAEYLKKFTEKANTMHANKYNYDKITFITNRIPVTITCPIHGDFQQTTSNHLKGHGCRKCQYENLQQQQKKEDAVFIQECNLVHSNKYSYEKTVYKNSNTRITVTCPVHGDFIQFAGHHVRGVGCPKCSSYGFNFEKPAILYYLSINDGECFKIGITNLTVSERYTISELSKIQILEEVICITGSDAYNKEQEILAKYKKYKYDKTTPLNSGNTELFNANLLTLKEHEREITSIWEL